MRKPPVLLVVGLIGLAAAAAVAAEPQEAPAIEVAGVVTVHKTAKGEFAGLAIKTTPTEALFVKMDDEGKKLLAQDGRQVKAHGSIEEKDGRKLMVVQKFAVVVESKKEPPKDAAKAPPKDRDTHKAIEPAKDAPKDTGKVTEAPKDVPKDAGKDKPAVKDTPKDAMKDKEPAKDVPKDKEKVVITE